MTDRGRVSVEPGSKRVRVMLGGVVIADTRSPLLVWEVPYYPTYYFPPADVRVDLLAATGETRSSPSRGVATQYVVKAGDAEGQAYAFHDSRIPECVDHYVFVWKTMDHWFEEDEEVYVHARDPYTRIDILPSSREVRVEIDGVTIAETTNATFLFETGLPIRYYIPKTHVRMDLLTPTERKTACPYKGTARYWSVSANGTNHENIVWGYDTPLPESQKIAGLVAFYNEKTDIYVEGVLQERPKTKFSLGVPRLGTKTALSAEYRDNFEEVSRGGSDDCPRTHATGTRCRGRSHSSATASPAPQALRAGRDASMPAHAIR